MPFHPYLFFGGNCREAFTRYEEIFGGELFGERRSGQAKLTRSVLPEEPSSRTSPLPGQ
jgi:uncharacterized glyoxalase superfamily protein PhnB